jgi:hypothetical protein
MADTTADFFNGLAVRRHEPLLEKAKGTMRLELVDGKKGRALGGQVERKRRPRARA